MYVSMIKRLSKEISTNRKHRNIYVEQIPLSSKCWICRKDDKKER